MAKYDELKIDYAAVYYSVQKDEGLLADFDAKGEHKVKDRLAIVNIGMFRKPSGKVQRAVFQTEVTHCYNTAGLAKFRVATKALDVTTVLNGDKPAPAPDDLAIF